MDIILAGLVGLTLGAALMRALSPRRTPTGAAPASGAPEPLTRPAAPGRSTAVRAAEPPAEPPLSTGVPPAEPDAEQRYRILFDSTPLPSLLFDLDTFAFIDVNPAAEAFYGYSRDEFLALTVRDLHTREDVPDAEIRVLNVREGEALRSAPTRHVCKDGLVRQVIIDSRAFPYQGRRVELAIIQDVTERLASDAAQERLILELREAAERVKTLRRLMPICSVCKKIRDDKGYWTQVEEYLRKHADAEFSHAICPECTRELYPEFAEDKEHTPGE